MAIRVSQIHITASSSCQNQCMTQHPARHSAAACFVSQTSWTRSTPKVDQPLCITIGRAMTQSSSTSLLSQHTITLTTRQHLRQLLPCNQTNIERALALDAVIGAIVLSKCGYYSNTSPQANKCLKPWNKPVYTAAHTPSATAIQTASSPHSCAPGWLHRSPAPAAPWPRQRRRQGTDPVVTAASCSSVRRACRQSRPPCASIHC